MNVQLRDITVTARDGRVSHLDQVYIRGSHVRFFIVPDMLRYKPLPLRLAEEERGEADAGAENVAGTLRCLDPGRFADEAWVWREEGLR